MRLLFTGFLLWFSLFSQAQVNTDDLVGFWKFKDIHHREKLDEQGAKMLEMFFGSMTLQFEANGLYQASMMGKPENGHWELLGKKQIQLTSDKGNVSTLELLELTTTTLVVGIEKGAFILEKTEPENSQKLEEPERVFEFVSATKEQISKKWYLVSSESDRELSAEMQAMKDQFLKDSFIDLKPNGKCEQYILGVGEKVAWEFGNANKSILIGDGPSKKMWNIMSITEDELVLWKGVSGQKWVFSAQAPEQ